MNYLVHALPFLGGRPEAALPEGVAPGVLPYFIAGTATPDWLVVADRPLRLRSKHVEPFSRDADLATAAVALGMLQHFRDDAHFHATRAFAELSLGITATVRDALGGDPGCHPGCDPGFRPSFLGHVLVEVLLDASFAASRPPSLLDRYYALLEAVDPLRVQQIVSRLGSRPTTRLAPMIAGFCRERILWDYLEDAKLLRRLNQVMRRVGLAELPERFDDLLPELRRRVAARQRELIDGLPTRHEPSVVTQPNADSQLPSDAEENERCDSE